MTVKKTQQTLSTTLEKTEQSLNGLEATLGNDVGGSLLATDEQSEANENNTGLPEGWVATNLENVILKIVGGGTPSKANPSFFEGSIPWMTVKDMNKHVLEDTVDHISQEAVDSSATNIIPAGTPIVATRMSLGKIVVANFDSAINQDLKALFSGEETDTDFLVYWYRSQGREVERLGTGTTVKGIRLEVLRGLNFPLPPLAEQTVIAQTLDTLQAQVANIKTRLDALPKIIKTIRQSVLAAAVSGKLTEEWRGENECGEWEECEFDTLLEEMRNGLSPKPNEDGVGYPIFRIGAVRPLEIDYSDMRYLECEDKIADRYRLQKNDLLFTRYNGSLDFVGVCGRIKEEQKDVVLYPDKLIRVRLKENAHPSYIELYFASPSIRRLVTDFVKSTSGQKGISGKDLKSVLIALPSTKEQTQIVRRVEELFAFADQIEQQVKNAQGRVNNLTQSILAKAFRGELTAQWRAEHPDLITGDNSAEALLAKIQAEREKLKPKKKTTRKKANG